jgi:hypothetical protein
MPAASRSRRSLAAVPAGEQVEIRAILFREVRAACELVGVREGDVVLCRESGPARIVLETQTGAVAILNPNTARFVAVRAPARATGAGRADTPAGAVAGAASPGEGSAA